MTLHLHESIDGLYFHCSLSVCLSVCLYVSQWKDAESHSSRKYRNLLLSCDHNKCFKQKTMFCTIVFQITKTVEFECLVLNICSLNIYCFHLSLSSSASIIYTTWQPSGLAWSSFGWWVNSPGQTSWSRLLAEVWVRIPTEASWF